MTNEINDEYKKYGDNMENKDFLARIERAKEIHDDVESDLIDFERSEQFLQGMREMLEQIEKDVKEVWLGEPEKLVEKLQTYAEALK